MNNEIFGPTDIVNCCDLTYIMIKRDDHCLLFCSAFQRFAWWRILESLTKYKAVLNDSEVRKFEVRDEKEFKEEPEPLFSTCPPDRHHLIPQGKILTVTVSCIQLFLYGKTVTVFGSV